VYVDIKKIKIGIFYVICLPITLAFVLLINLLFALTEVSTLTDTEGIIGSAIMMLSILTVIFLPITIYMLNAKMRYKRIVEYRTSEWKRLQK